MRTNVGRKKAAKTRRQTRAPEHTRDALLKAAVAELEREGDGGARVDRISRAAKSNDRMRHYYFNSKEKLFHQVMSIAMPILSRKEARSRFFAAA